MKKLLITFLFLFLPLMADSEKSLLDEAIVESAITPQQKQIVGRYFQRIIKNKEDQIKRLEDQILISYGGKFQREKIIKDSIRNEISYIHQEIESYKIVLNGLQK